MLTENDIAERATGIGASEIAAVAGLDPHRGPTDVWLSKMGLAKPTENVAQWTGHKLESVIAEMYAEKTGAKLVPGGGTQRHPRLSFAVATLDFRANPGPAPVVEIKNVGAWGVRAWRDGAPVEKVLQAQWQMLVCDVPLVHVAALIGGTDFRICPVERDEETIGGLVEIAERFWVDHVLARRPPVDDPDARAEALGLLYPKAMAPMLPRTPEAEAVWLRLREIEHREELLKAEKTAAQNAAKELLGEAEGVDGLFTWKPQRGRINWETAAKAAGVTEGTAERFRGSPTRVLRVKKGKES